MVPSGYFGSISHKGPLAIAIAARGQARLGIDLECAEATDLALAQSVLGSPERDVLSGLDGASQSLFVALHLAAKEAIYKAMPAAEQVDLAMEDIELSVPRGILRTQEDWIPVEAKVRGDQGRTTLTVLIEGAWMIATASAIP